MIDRGDLDEGMLAEPAFPSFSQRWSRNKSNEKNLRLQGFAEFFGIEKPQRMNESWRKASRRMAFCVKKLGALLIDYRSKFIER